MSSPVGHRANNFDALRLVAALLVIWGHQFAVMGLPVPHLLDNEPGAVGVVLFFGISGYLVTISWLSDPHLLRFTARRMLRIWPALAVVVIGAMAVLGPLTTGLSQHDYWRHDVTWQYLSNLWLNVRYALPGVFDGNPHPSSVNGPLWTIPLEVTCYLILAAFGLLGCLRWRWFAPALCAALLGWLQWRYQPRPGVDAPAWSQLLQYGIMFAWGAALASWRSLWLPRPWLAIAALIAFWALVRWQGPAIISGQALLLMLVSVGVIWGTASTPVLRRVGRFGDFSYGLYIYAFPVQQWVVWAFSNRLGFAAALGLTLVITFALAALSWHWIEKPALAFKPRSQPLATP